MRVYALLLGVVFTAAYGFAAQVAVSSVGGGGPAAAEPSAPGAAVAADAVRDRLWYGGTIDPITVESGRGAARATATADRRLDHRFLRCIGTPHPAYRAVS